MSNYEGKTGPVSAGELRERIDALRQTFELLQARIQRLEVLSSGNQLDEVLQEARAASQQVLLAALTLFSRGGVQLGENASAEDAWHSLHPDGLEAGRCLADAAWWQGQFREYLRVRTAGEIARALSETDAGQAQAVAALQKKQERLQEDVRVLAGALDKGQTRLEELSGRVGALAVAAAAIQPEASRIAENAERVRRIAEDLRRAAGVGE